ncbi:family 16 glycosylhydrolase [Flavicella marina]|uniref:family 16 glycosylhydrolase n=1 Tax=Flavicella marina TaxID=1475951 RepID=UPI001D008894|nr:family 16 glycosylhydrolase [Flavicella marina]
MNFVSTKVLLMVGLLGLFSCGESNEELIEYADEEVEFPEDPVIDDTPKVLLPASDQQNSGNWVLNEELSDEFEGQVLDETKWLVQGRNGEFKSRFVGRAPSQFSTDNVKVENGKLMLETRWDPDYNFIPKIVNGLNYDEVNGEKIYFENITTAAVIAKKSFTYGYLEIKSKAADAEVTSSFWATGGGTEFDFFEMFGDHKQTNKERAGKERELWWSIHDWTNFGNGRTTYTEHHDLGFRVADDFHIYGYEWNENEVKIYIDGQLFRNVSREVINAYDDTNLGGGNGDRENFVVTQPIYVWFDQETFPWHGVPDSKSELGTNGSVFFEIEYYRLWQ